MTSDALRRIEYLGIIFWVGFAALIYQIYSVDVLFLFFVQNTYAVALAVSSFLAGLAFSSLLFSRLTHHNTRNRKLVCFMALAAGLYGYLVLPHYEWIPLWTDAIRRSLLHWPVIATLLKYCIMWLYLFFPAFFLGGAFPLINGLYLSSREESARDTGTVYFWDTLGAIAGALTAGFVLLPHLGLKPTAMIAAAINVLLGLHLLSHRRVVMLLTVCFAGVVLVEVYCYNNPSASYGISDAGHIIMPMPKDMDSRYGQILFQKESPYGQITVGSHNKGKQLFINYRTMCTGDGFSEVSLADNAMLASKPGAQVMNVGLGCGRTASALARNPHTQHLDVVEINPVIPEATAIFAKENNDILHAKNMHLHIEDGAEWLRTRKKQYDAIVIDVEEVSVIYSSPLYTKEYFTIIRDRLRPDGVFALWSFAISPQFTRVMYNTLKSVFPYVEIQSLDGQFIHCYASMQPLQLPKQLPPSQIFEKEFMALPLDDVNTLESRALERYYSSNRTFSLPAYYKEKFVR